MSVSKAAKLLSSHPFCFSIIKLTTHDLMKVCDANTLVSGLKKVVSKSYRDTAFFMTRGFRVEQAEQLCYPRWGRFSLFVPLIRNIFGGSDLLGGNFSFRVGSSL